MIALPESATVFMLRGKGASLDKMMSGWCDGVFDDYDVRQIEYPASGDYYSIRDGVVMLNEAVQNVAGHVAGPIIVVGQSQGAQVADRWMEKYRNDPTAPRNMIFVLTGNPNRNPTGRMIGQPEYGGTIGRPTPTDYPWPVIDVARSGDPWAIQRGWFLNWWGSIFIHPFYQGVNIFDPANDVVQVGNTTFVTTK